MSLRALLDTRTPRSNRRRRKPTNSRLAVETLEDRHTPAAMLTIADASVVEGNTGTTNALVQVSLTEPHGNNVTVKYSTVDGSALAGSDYNAASGTLTFSKNEVTKTLTIPIRGDRVPELTEYFTVQLSNAKGAKIADGVANVTISDNEPHINIGNWSATEGDSGTQEFTFDVSLSAAYDQTVTVDFATADGSAAAGADYVAKNGTVTFVPGGPTSQTIKVIVNGDHFVEGDEYFTVNLSNASSNAQIGNGVGYAWIYDDEPFITIDGWSATEGNSGTQEFTFNVTLSRAYDQIVTVDFATADGSAVAGADYVAKNGTVTFTPGQPTTQTIKVLVNGDQVAEPTEYFTVNLSNPSSNAQISNDVGYGWIYDDEPQVSIYDAYQDYYGSSITFYVYLSAPSDDVVTVDYQTWDGYAIAGSDYVATSGTLTFNPGETVQSFTVQLLNYDPDPYKYFSVQLSNASPPVQIGNGWANGYWYYDWGYGW